MAIQTDKELSLPTEFTVEQLARMAELASSAYSQTSAPSDYNLFRKLTEYCSTASRFHGYARRAG